MAPLKIAKRLCSKAYQNRGETIHITPDLKCYVIYNRSRYAVYNLGTASSNMYRSYAAACYAVCDILEYYKPEVQFMASIFK